MCGFRFNKMKKVHLIIICFLCSLNAMGQQTAPTDEVMRLTLPKGTVKLNEQKLKTLSHRKFDDNMASSFTIMSTKRMVC